MQTKALAGTSTMAALLFYIIIFSPEFYVQAQVLTRALQTELLPWFET